MRKSSLRKEWFSLKVKQCMVNIDWIRWHRSAVEGTKCSRKFRNSSHALIPSLWGMLVYKEVTSSVTSKVPGGSDGNLLSDGKLAPLHLPNMHSAINILLATPFGSGVCQFYSARAGCGVSRWLFLSRPRATVIFQKLPILIGQSSGGTEVYPRGSVGCPYGGSSSEGV